MKRFLYKSSFFPYMEGGYSNPNRKAALLGPFVTMYVLMFIYIFGTIYAKNLTAMFIVGIGLILFITGATYGRSRSNKPNLASLMPISYKKRIVYDFVVVLVGTVIILFMVLALFLVAGLIGFLIDTLVGEAVSSEGEEVEEAVSVFNRAGVYGGIFCAVYLILTYSVGLISSYIKSRKYSNVFLLCFVVLFTLGTTLTGIPILSKTTRQNLRSPVALPFSNECYKYMSVPWLCILLWCLVAAGTFAAAIYMSYKYHKPKAF